MTALQRQSQADQFVQKATTNSGLSESHSSPVCSMDVRGELRMLSPGKEGSAGELPRLEAAGL